MLDIVFETSRFGLSGQEFLRWLAGELQPHGVETQATVRDERACEMQARHGKTKYSIAVSVQEPQSDGASGDYAEWRVLVRKHRSLIERTLGTNPISDTDPILWMIESALHGEADVRNVRRERPKG